MYYVIKLQMPPVIMIRSLNNQLIIRRSETLPTAVADNDWYVHSSTSVVLTPGSRRPQPLDYTADALADTLQIDLLLRSRFMADGIICRHLCLSH